MRYLIIAFLVVGCASDNSGSSSGGVGATGGSTTVVGVAEPNCSNPLLTNQLLIPCPELTSDIPVILIKQGTNVLLMQKVGGSISYTLQPPGQYSASDSRGCNYQVNADGSVTSI